MIHITKQRGFTLLIAVVLTSVLLSVGLALLDISYKQIMLSSTARQSQYAFYAADSAIECALFWDQKRNAFQYGASPTPIRCANTQITVTSTTTSGYKESGFYTPCINNTQAKVTVYKYQAGGSDTCNGGTTCIYADGFNSCNVSDARRIERGLKVFY